MTENSSIISLPAQTVLVEGDDERPARMDGTCFYCSEKLGTPHLATCVIPQKTVRVRVTLDLITDVPWCSDYDQEFNWNDGTWCAGNLISALVDNEEDDLCAYSRFDIVEVVDPEPHRNGPHWSVARGHEFELGSPCD